MESPVAEARAARLPIRTCVGCRAAVPQAELVRIATVEGKAVADPRRRLPGRGAYVHARPACLVAAGKGGLARSFKRNVNKAELDGLTRALGVASGGASAPADAGTPGGSPEHPVISTSGQSGADAVEIGSPSTTRTMSNPRPTSANATVPSDGGAERSRPNNTVEVPSTVGANARVDTEQ